MLIFFLGVPKLQAQDYTKQFEALKQSIKVKNGAALKPYISTEMAIPPLVTKEQLTPALLDQVLEGVLKEINTITLKEYKVGEIVVFYDFVDKKIKDRASTIIFDSEGKIKEIKIIGDLIREAQERKLGKDAEQPIADEFTKKYPSKKIEFKTSDNRIVVGNLYDIGIDNPVVLLCHQLGYNKYEYADIAPKLNAMGFNALAIDLTGGGNFASYTNETIDKGTPVSDRQIAFNKSKEEINTAVNYLFKKYNKKVIIWGSSFSANYAISITAKNQNAKAAISFSGLANGLSEVLKKMNKPLFMTSSKEEVPQVKTILEAIPSRQNLTHFIPKNDGDHGSSVLWNGQPYAEEYWDAVKAFLNKIK